MFWASVYNKICASRWAPQCFAPCLSSLILCLLRLSETKAKNESKVICIICQMAAGDVPCCLARRVSPLITWMNKAWISLSWEVLAMIFDKNLHTITTSWSNYVSKAAMSLGFARCGRSVRNQSHHWRSAQNCKTVLLFEKQQQLFHLITVAPFRFVLSEAAKLNFLLFFHWLGKPTVEAICEWENVWLSKIN